MKSKNAVALIRVSSESQAGPDREGLPAQKRLVRRIAEQNDLVITEWLEMEGVSGASVLSDPRFVRLLTLLQRPDVGGVIVAEFSRLMRPERLSDYQILEAFRGSGKLLYTPEGVRDLRDFTGRMTSVLQGEMAAYERQIISERTRRGREEKRRRGRRAEGLVGMPRGVTFDKATGQWSYVRPEADVVRRVYDLFLQSDGTLALAQIAKRVGWHRKHNGSWAVTSVLRQPLYMGVYRVDRRWRRVVEPNGKMAIRCERRPPDECYEHLVIEPPLVTREEWERVQDLLARRRPRRAPRRDPEEQEGDYSGLIDCADCGAAMWTHPSSWRRDGTRRGWAAYHCPTDGCPTGHTSVRLADAQIDRALEARLGSEALLTAMVQAALDEGDRKAIGSIKAAERRLVELANAKSRLVDLYAEGRISREAFVKKDDLNAAERAALERLIAREGADGVELTPELIAKLAEVFGSWTILRRDEKRRMLGELGARVVVGRERKRELVVREVRLSSPNVSLCCKKMKRFGID